MDGGNRVRAARAGWARGDRAGAGCAASGQFGFTARPRRRGGIHAGRGVVAGGDGTAAGVPAALGCAIAAVGLTAGGRRVSFGNRVRPHHSQKGDERKGTPRDALSLLEQSAEEADHRSQKGYEKPHCQPIGRPTFRLAGFELDDCDHLANPSISLARRSLPAPALSHSARRGEVTTSLYRTPWNLRTLSAGVTRAQVGTTVRSVKLKSWVRGIDSGTAYRIWRDDPG